MVSEILHVSGKEQENSSKRDSTESEWEWEGNGE